jgi:hypothetical protein
VSFVVSKGHPDAIQDAAKVLPGAWVVTALFLVTIAMAISSHNLLHMPPVLGMMASLGLVEIYAYFLGRRDEHFPAPASNDLGIDALELETGVPAPGKPSPHNIIFLAHLKWSWAIMLGYGASVWVHFLVNGERFT